MERIIDAVIGSSLILAGLFYCVLSLFFMRGETTHNKVFDRPVSMIPIGILRISKGREAARNYRP